ncbi:antitoxin YefM [Streptomyces sp. WMMB 322]|nr:antitoxin YefM [Streptomyces sp. WMMB 322]
MTGISDPAPLLLVLTTRKEVTMSITAGEARKSLLRLIEQVNDDRSPVHITSRSGNAALLSEEDYSSWQETVRSMRPPANTGRPAESAGEAGTTGPHGLRLTTDPRTG